LILRPDQAHNVWMRYCSILELDCARTDGGWDMFIKVNGVKRFQSVNRYLDQA